MFTPFSPRDLLLRSPEYSILQRVDCIDNKIFITEFIVRLSFCFFSSPLKVSGIKRLRLKNLYTSLTKKLHQIYFKRAKLIKKKQQLFSFFLHITL